MGDLGDHPNLISFSLPKKPQGQRFGCTAFFVKPRVMLTAAHCLVSDELVPIKTASVIYVHNRFLSVVGFGIDPGFVDRSLSEDQRFDHDLAWIKVDLPGDEPLDLEGTSGLYEIATEPPRAGALLEFQGFGYTSPGKSAANKNPRRGYNEIRRVNDRWLEIDSPTSVVKGGDVPSVGQAINANTLDGDSGGLALVAGRVVGITSRGAVRLWSSVGRFVNLTGPIGRAFLAQLP